MQWRYLKQMPGYYFNENGCEGNDEENNREDGNFDCEEKTKKEKVGKISKRKYKDLQLQEKDINISLI